MVKVKVKIMIFTYLVVSIFWEDFIDDEVSSGLLPGDFQVAFF